MVLIFMGTPAFAVPTLERVIEAGHRVSAVFTQPDRPKGRGGNMAASPVKEAALRLGLPVHQPERIRRPEVVEQLKQMKPDAMIVVGYGQIVPQAIINVHASLLPKYRGAAPIQWAVANGETRTGVTTMRIDAGLDTGDMLLKWETEIRPEENALELGTRLAAAGAQLLVETLLDDPAPVKQDPGQATYAPILKKEHGEIDWNWPASKIFNRSRGLLPWPGVYSFFRGQMFHIWEARVSSDALQGEPGLMSAMGKRLLVACGERTELELMEVQVEGRKRMSAAAFMNGHHLKDDEMLGVKVA
jgi:methionyl-tRNA formyltransferase